MAIKVLPHYLINQISAGEVIDSPASVVKELVENSIDAGANRIDIHIKQGGKKLIQIQDNGYGIVKNEISLALQRHTTSKITSIEDLESLTSLGFRGEALTSISSVSRLTLTSRTQAHNQAWQIYTEGNQINHQIVPATHPIGTTVKVLDLFYNTPVRRKFMKTEKAEFNNIDNILKQLLLSRFDISISLSHDEHLVYYQPVVTTETEIQRRLKFIFGADFNKHSLSINHRSNDLFIHGWIAEVNVYRIINDLQYSYVNKRIVKNKLINNAIRQSFRSILQNNSRLAYVIYLEIKPCQIDINIHPTKKEIRFYEPRLINHFIIQGITNVAKCIIVNNPTIKSCHKENKNELEINNSESQNNTFSLPDWYFKEDVSNAIKNNMTGIYKLPSSFTYSNYFGQLLAILYNSYVLLKKNQKLILMSIPTSLCYLRKAQLKHCETYFKSRPLLFPLKIKINELYCKILKDNHTLIKKTGIDLMIEKDHLTLHAIPSTFHEYNLKNLIYAMLNHLNQQKKNYFKQLVHWLGNYEDKSKVISWNILKANILLAEIEYFCPDLLTKPPANLIQHIDIKNTIKMFNDE
ncbi:DNA mismatch repair protein MutL [Candidatus Pantoea edessiphila]|uniref:DNA mismatch repair protein MutL n=1 Tax=Candidatus Pantoea edessiphila TaxID=2044610 RepID=A0A2P5SXU7_9GAMM|nr:DNA mismatch repair endonuclease MutL [Candidatus Pantoea edessiphila]MBK4775726.1 DNA mismatch repair endonuclease MutL [Pantoea sp. Edef]PPI87123.1 DNA mismatch repair protein MutL [Candidatus Pantoea edessiphila]